MDENEAAGAKREEAKELIFCFVLFFSCFDSLVPPGLQFHPSSVFFDSSSPFSTPGQSNKAKH